MSDTSFRTWMIRLKNDKGARPEWTRLLSWMLEDEFVREQQIGRQYTGQNVLIDRADHNYKVKKAENRAMYGLYHRSWSENGGCLQINTMPVLLLSYEVPNQGNHSGRCADLLGLTESGGLIVFEGKLGENSHPPISAILEGLDYLSCLTSEKTFKRLTDEFLEWKSKRSIPKRFQKIVPDRSVPPRVVVLADDKYFTKHDSHSDRSPGWREMVKHGQKKKSITMGFALAKLDENGFFSPKISWLI